MRRSITATLLRVPSSYKYNTMHGYYMRKRMKKECQYIVSPKSPHFHDHLSSPVSGLLVFLSLGFICICHPPVSTQLTFNCICGAVCDLPGNLNAFVFFSIVIYISYTFFYLLFLQLALYESVILYQVAS